ncbi:MAG: SDR family oxidoreductase [Deltaproteobacteria bacterium]|nr:SDR family oxidoreductase [Deltaproteobacteria bacterium]
MARVLVSGGAGFIGSHLCDALLKQGNEVLCLDNLFTGSKRNIQAHFANPDFEFIRHDVTQPILLEVDKIYHLACPASPVDYQYNSVKTIKTNVMGTINMLGIAKRVKARFLLASTSEVYGDPLQHPQKESYWGNVNPIGPRSCYDEGKRVAETLTVNYHNEAHGKVNTGIVRIFNTYGPRMLFDDGRVVSNFIVQSLKGEEITVYGEGSQTRSFCYVDDMVAGLMATMEKSGFSGPVNLGNPVETTILELAKLIVELTGSRSKIVHKPLPQDDPTRRRPDITLAQNELGWQPKTDLKTGLQKTIEDFSRRMGAKRG